MQFKTGQTVVRHDPGERETTWSIQSEQDVKYHTELAERGYRYTDITKGTEVDFNLPDVPASKVSAARVHIGGSTCVGCEG